MKHRAITFAFAACLVSSLAFADKPVDAYLVPSNRNAFVQQENRSGHNRRHPNKKDESPAAKAKSGNLSKNSRQSEQTRPEYAATGNY